MSQRHERCYNLTQDWIKWLDSKRFYGQPPQKNILEILQNVRSGKEPDGRLSPELNAFNICLKAQEEEYLIPFLVVYTNAADKPAKVYAAQLDISLPAFYDRANKTATTIYRQHLDLVDLYEKMKRELHPYV